MEKPNTMTNRVDQTLNIDVAARTKVSTAKALNNNFTMNAKTACMTGNPLVYNHYSLLGRIIEAQKKKVLARMV